MFNYSPLKSVVIVVYIPCLAVGFCVFWLSLVSVRYFISILSLVVMFLGFGFYGWNERELIACVFLALFHF